MGIWRGVGKFVGWVCFVSWVVSFGMPRGSKNSIAEKSTSPFEHEECKPQSRAHKLSLTNNNKLNVTNNNKLSITINNTAYTLSLYSRDNKMPMAHLSTMEVLVVLVESISNLQTSKPSNRIITTTKCCPFFQQVPVHHERLRGRSGDHEDSDRITPLAHAESLPNTSPSSPQQHSPDPASLAPQSKLCQTAPPCLTDLFEELLHDIPGLHEDPLPPVNTLHPSPQLPHAVVLPEHPYKQQRTRASSLSPSDDEQASEKEATLDKTQAQAQVLSRASEPRDSRPLGWDTWSRTIKQNWKRRRNKKDH